MPPKSAPQDIGPVIDTHCHLDHQRFGDEAEEVINRAVQSGVSRMVTIGCATDAASVPSALRIARAHPDRIRATVGVHPHDASSLSDEVWDAVELTSRDPLVVGVGETGLDYHYDHSPRDLQREAFRRHIALARRCKKPIIVHTRNAAAETLSILEEERANDVGGIIHCFSEDPAFAKRALDLGFVSSFSGLVTFSRGAEDIRQAAAQQPEDAILVETDAPFLAPVPHRGKRNEPAYVVNTAVAVAGLRGQDPQALAAQTCENAFRVFGAW